MPFSVVGFPLFSVRACACGAGVRGRRGVGVGLPACLPACPPCLAGWHSRLPCSFRFLLPVLRRRRRRLFRVKFRFRLRGLISHKDGGGGDSTAEEKGDDQNKK